MIKRLLTAYRRRKSVPPKKFNDALPDHLKIGILGENIAAEHYIQNGYVIIDRGYTIEKNEIDFIAEDKHCFVFCEVKTRIGTHSEAMYGGRPAAAVDKEKMRHLIQAASFFVKRHRNAGKRFRFDVVEIYLNTDLTVDYIYIIPNAFSKNSIR